MFVIHGHESMRPSSYWNRDNQSYVGNIDRWQ